jgi:hypothetical protein
LGFILVVIIILLKILHGVPYIRKDFFLCIAVFSIFLLLAAPVNSEDTIPVCDKLGDKVTGEMMKYSFNADVDGPVFFGDIACAVKFRTKEFCAMKMVSFGSSAKVYDYNTATEIEIGKAYFVVDEKNKSAQIPAFESKNAAEKYAAEHQGCTILDYTALVERDIN